jgi:hypothetical protein
MPSLCCLTVMAADGPWHCLAECGAAQIACFADLRKMAAPAAHWL